jgi:2-keto-3-deoxy-L-rhamnonate aldolase RhmA
MSQATKRLFEKLKNGKSAIGTHITCNDPQLTELIGDAGFDYLWIDTEHAPIEKTALLTHLIAARACDIPAFVRIPWNDMVLAKPILDLGADGIIFPMVKTREDAEYAVSSCLYPPEGIRGFGPRRATHFGKIPMDKFIAQEHKNVVKLIQIETCEAVENIDQIASVPGVDVIIIGPMDLSGAYGKLTKVKDPEMQRIYRHVAERGRKAGKPVLVSTGGYDYDTIAMWHEIGANMITVGNEPTYINAGLKATLKSAREVFGEN